MPDVAGPPTPCLVVDRAALERNIAATTGLATGRGLALRPHAKTHKCPRVAELQLAGGAVGLTVATVGEAEVFVAAGCRDVFIAYPLWLDADRARRLAALAELARVRIGVESPEGAETTGRRLAGVPGIEVLIEIDSGQHRTGCPPELAGRVAADAVGAGLDVRGVFTFPGHGYRPGAAAAAATDEAAALRTAARGLRERGLRCAVLSGGSSPTLADTDGSVVTEVRPGVSVFWDAQQVELGHCVLGDVALTACATVVSSRPGEVVLDAGSKILGADRPAWASGFGRLADHPQARVTALSEHHATVAFPGDWDRPRLGERVRVVPNHVCAAVNLVDELVVTTAGGAWERWPVAARGANG